MAQGKTCDSFIFGYGNSAGGCYWEHGDCTEYIPVPYNLFDLEKVDNPNPAFKLRMAATSCMPNGSDNEAKIEGGPFETPQDCFNACLEYATAQGSTCDTFSMSTGTGANAG